MTLFYKSLIFSHHIVLVVQPLFGGRFLRDALDHSFQFQNGRVLLSVQEDGHLVTPDHQKHVHGEELVWSKRVGGVEWYQKRPPEDSLVGGGRGWLRNVSDSAQKVEANRSVEQGVVRREHGGLPRSTSALLFSLSDVKILLFLFHQNLPFSSTTATLQ